MFHRKPILECNLSCRITLRTFWYLRIFVSHPPQHIEEHTLNPFILNFYKFSPLFFSSFEEVWFREDSRSLVAFSEEVTQRNLRKAFLAKTEPLFLFPSYYWNCVQHSFSKTKQDIYILFMTFHLISNIFFFLIKKNTSEISRFLLTFYFPPPSLGLALTIK